MRLQRKRSFISAMIQDKALSPVASVDTDINIDTIAKSNAIANANTNTNTNTNIDAIKRENRKNNTNICTYQFTTKMDTKNTKRPLSFLFEGNVYSKSIYNFRSKASSPSNSASMLSRILKS